jgi:hypothetical protein
MKVYYNRSIENFLHDALKNTRNPIAYFMIHKTVQSSFSFLDAGEDDVVTLTPENKILKLYNTGNKNLSYQDFLDSLHIDKTGPGYTSNRISIKMGRLVKRILDDNREYWDRFIQRYRMSYDETKTEDEMVEELVMQYKAATKKMFDKGFDTRIEQVKGLEIRKWYNHVNYKTGKGSLHGSCMRYDNCTTFFEIYEKNPEVCSLLIYRDSPDKIAMRALLWRLDNGNFYLDRIYAADEADKTIFINYAKRNGWVAYDTHKNSLPADMKIKLQNLNYSKYPYMDTFKWYNRTTKEARVSKNDYESDQINLTDASGGYKNG